MLKNKSLTTLSLVAAALVGPLAAIAQDAQPSDMMMHCNTYAAKHLGLSPSEIADLSYEGQRTDGTHAVNGSTSTGLTFQCSFGPQGHKVVQWTHSAPAGCPSDVSEADRYLYPDCD